MKALMRAEIIKRTRKTKNRIFAISEAVPATPVKPSRPAMTAMTRNINVHLSICMCRVEVEGT